MSTVHVNGDSLSVCQSLSYIVLCLLVILYSNNIVHSVADLDAVKSSLLPMHQFSNTDYLHLHGVKDNMDSLKTATSYDQFDTDAYYQKYRVPLNSDCSTHKFIRFVLDSLHEAFISGSITGDRLLDVGTGASLMSFLSASRCVKEIHLSDLLQRHRDILQKWLEGEDREHDMVEYIIGKEHDGISCEKRLMELRRKVTNIKSIDVTKKLPLQEPDEGLYDIITSAFCLEVATKSVSEFKMAVEHIGRLLNHGGFLILIGSLQENFYIVGNVKFWNACIKEKDVTSALDAAGFTILSWKLLKREPGPYDIYTVLEFEGFFVVVAQKSHNKDIVLRH